IIRIGSAGSYSPELKLYDVVLASSAWSESTYAHTMSGYTGANVYPCAQLNRALEESAARQNIPVKTGDIHSSDVFYCESSHGGPPRWHALRDEKGLVAVEMEAFALLHNASAAGKKAACLLTISDDLVTHEKATAGERQNSFMDMVKIALGII
ncbi:MAG: purine nucleoside phosphorylase DeoD-type, partial [Clostridiales bacterium]|nr:purine nucleoside phosphorylase DeoD-type [Clostridiales bacterium]